MAKTKILYLSHSSGTNGAEICLLTLLRSIDRSRFEPMAVLPEAGPLGELIRALDIVTYVRPLERWIRFPTDTALPESDGQARVRDLAAIIDRNDISIVQTNSTLNYEGALAARLTRRPHVCHVHETLVNHPELSPVLPLEMVFRLLSELSATLVTEADMVHAQFDGHVEPGKLRTIHTGVTLPSSAPPPSSGRASLGLAEGPPLVGIVGTLSERKGYPVLIEAAAAVAARGCPAQFVWIGPASPAARSDWIHRIAERKLEGVLHYAGFRQDVRDLLSALDLVVMPSTNEAFPVALLEAMAAGKPVVATRCGAVPELVAHNETGLIVDVGDPAGLADAVVALVSSPPLARRMGARGAEVVRERFTADVYARRFERLYDELLCAPPAPPVDRGDALRLADAIHGLARHTPVQRHATLFVRTPRGYDPTTAVRRLLPENVDSGDVSLDFDLGGIEDVRELRFDPIEGVPSAVEVIRAEGRIDGRWQPLPLVRSNAIWSQGAVRLFQTADPNLYFEVPEGTSSPDRFRVRLRYRTGDAYTELACRVITGLKDVPPPPVVATLFVDAGDGYSARQAVACTIPWATAISGQVLSLDFPVASCEQIREIRFDPLEGRAVGLTVHRAEARRGDLAVPLHPAGSNAVLSREDLFLFGTTDPQLRFRGALDAGGPLTIHLEVSYLLEAEFDQVATLALATLQHPPVTATLFVDTGEGYSDAQAVACTVPWSTAASGRVLSLDFPVTLSQQVREVRFDPLEGHAVALSLCRAEARRGETVVPLEAVGSNAVLSRDDLFLFGTTDPQIRLGGALAEGGAQTIHLEVAYVLGEEFGQVASGALATLQPPPVVSTLYVDSGGGYSAERAASIQVPPDLASSGRFSVEFPVAALAPLRQVRFDPAEGEALAISLDTVEACMGGNRVRLEPCRSNALVEHGPLFFFDTPDPTVYFDVPDRAALATAVRVEWTRLSPAESIRLEHRAALALGREPILVTLYVETGAGFSEDAAVRRLVYRAPGETVAVEFDLGGFGPIAGLRFDPVAELPALIELRSAYVEAGGERVEAEVRGCNAVRRWASTFLFATPDPRIFFSLAGGTRPCDRLHVEFVRHDIRAYAERLAEFVTASLGEPAVATLLIDDGSGYTQERAIHCEFQLPARDRRLLLEFPLDRFDRIAGLRFDPIEGSGIVVEIHDIHAVTGTKTYPVAVSDSNAHRTDGGRYVFLTDDPVCYLSVPAGLQRVDTLSISLTYACSPHTLLALVRDRDQ